MMIKSISISIILVLANTVNAQSVWKPFTESEWNARSNEITTASAQLMTGRDWVDDTDKASAKKQLDFSLKDGEVNVGFFQYSVAKLGGFINQDDVDDYDSATKCNTYAPVIGSTADLLTTYGLTQATNAFVTLNLVFVSDVGNQGANKKEIVYGVPASTYSTADLTALNIYLKEIADTPENRAKTDSEADKTTYHIGLNTNAHFYIWSLSMDKSKKITKKACKMAQAQGSVGALCAPIRKKDEDKVMIHYGITKEQ